MSEMFLMSNGAGVQQFADGPFDFEIDPAAQIVSLRYNEPATFERFVTSVEAVVTHPDYRPGFHFLIDRKNVHRAPAVPYVESVLAYMQQHRGEFQRARWAVLTDPNDPAVRGMARMLAVRADLSLGIQIDVFHDETQARIWLVGGQR